MPVITPGLSTTLISSTSAATTTTTSAAATSATATAAARHLLQFTGASNSVTISYIVTSLSTPTTSQASAMLQLQKLIQTGVITSYLIKYGFSNAQANTYNQMIVDGASQLSPSLSPTPNPTAYLSPGKIAAACIFSILGCCGCIGLVVCCCYYSRETYPAEPEPPSLEEWNYMDEPARQPWEERVDMMHVNSLQPPPLPPQLPSDVNYYRNYDGMSLPIPSSHHHPNRMPHPPVPPPGYISSQQMPRYNAAYNHHTQRGYLPTPNDSPTKM